MTLSSDQLKTVIIELGALEYPILDTKIMKLARHRSRDIDIANLVEPIP